MGCEDNISGVVTLLRLCCEKTFLYFGIGDRLEDVGGKGYASHNTTPVWLYVVIGDGTGKTAQWITPVTLAK